MSTEVQHKLCDVCHPGWDPLAQYVNIDITAVCGVKVPAGSKRPPWHTPRCDVCQKTHCPDHWEG